MRLLLLLCFAAEAFAHVGATVSKATFTSPAAPEANPTDGGLSLKPYTFATADASFTVSWNVDFPNDPTGRFHFYWLDHMPPSAITYDQIVSIATPIPEASGDANGYWISCSCDMDAGVICPDAMRNHCGMNSFVWDTSGLQTGVYWIIAANFDSPYKIYSAAAGPVRIAHGGAPYPPAAIVVLPDGLFATDKTYNTVWIATGQAPLKFDVFYGINQMANVLDPPTTLGTNITPIMNGDGSFSYIWNTANLVEGLYYFGVKVSDGTGQSSFTDSQLGENVYHPPEDGGLIFVEDAAPNDLLKAPDLSIVLQPTNDGGCSCQIAGVQSAIPLAAGLLAAAALALALRRRR
jgi:MYXO-CTERM domain-containing protein